MATKQYAIPLNDGSKQDGDTNFKTLAEAGTSATFRLTNVSAGGSGNELNLITKKNGQTKDHVFAINFGSGVADVTVTASELDNIYGDAGSDWDYVEAQWKVGGADTPNPSVMEIVQSNVVYNNIGWPPKGT